MSSTHRSAWLYVACVFVCMAIPARQGYSASVEESYTRACAQCHRAGIAGAPQVGDKAEWSRRVRPGVALLYRSAIEGVPDTAMMAKGGHTDIPDDEVRRIVDYMLAAAALDADVLAAARRYEKLGIRDRDFIRLDVDYDGFLARKEVLDDAVLASNFQRFDKDGDGRLSAVEYREAEKTLETERMAVNVDDAALVQSVRAALANVAGLNVSSTKVEADHGTVAMVGIVSNAEIVRRAYATVKRVPGIKKIDNRLVSAEQMGWD